MALADSSGRGIQSISKGAPDQNAYVERFNRTYRDAVLNLYPFRHLADVREATCWWRIDYDEHRTHNGRTPVECMNQNVENSPFQRSP